MDRIIVASHNLGKIKEIKKILEPLGVEVESAAELHLGDVEETGTTFEENARLKSEHFAKETGFWSLADDSGLCVKALNGRPGVYSARYAPNRDFDKGMDMLLEELSQAESKDRSAAFVCVLALTSPNGKTKIFEGKVEGKIAESKKGKDGFGFDALFVPENLSQTFAEISQEEKNKMSHRGRALQKLIEYIKTEK
ncbi:MAG: XTP/dITP diphosphatase [Alphaproteobacteria bacterium]|nr:XTP/dITP diphosphatase [Alphaproteobacteria bacterium]